MGDEVSMKRLLLAALAALAVLRRGPDRRPS